MTDPTYKRIFLFGALWNLLGGAFILATTNWIFSTAGVTPPSPPLYYQAWIGLFMVFGLGYYFVSRDLYRNRDIALLGAIGKIVFAAIFLYNMSTFRGQVPQFFLIPVVGDLVFAALFLIFFFAALRSGRT